VRILRSIMPETRMNLTPQQHEQCARALFNFTWTLLEKAQRSADETDLMISAAHASLLHWHHIGRPVNFARGHWQVSRAYAVAGCGGSAVRHAQRCLSICQEEGIGGFDLAFAYEALARAHSVAGESKEAGRFLDLAREAGGKIEDPEEAEHFFEDLHTIPGWDR
jgi:hypothetical protein